MIKVSNPNWLVYTISGFAALAGLLFGYDTGIISGAILFIKKDFSLTNFQIEMVVSAVLFGALLGSGVSGRVSDIFGRRKVLVFTALTFIKGSLITAFSPNLVTLIMGRIILGIAIGVGSFTAPLYLAEIAPKRIRGMLVSLNQLAITIGIVFSYLINYYFSVTGQWPWMLGLGVVPAIILLLGTIFLPESPRWMILKGWDEKVRAVLQSLREKCHFSNSRNWYNQCFIYTIIALPLIDRWGRRPLLLYGLLGMFSSLAILGAAFYFPAFTTLRWVAVVSMIIYIASFAMSLGPIMWLIISEIFPLNIRGIGASLAISASWGFNMLVSITFLTLVEFIGTSHTFWLYALLCVLAWIFVYFIVPETKNCSLEQIESNLRLGRPSRELGVPLHFSSLFTILEKPFIFFLKK